VALALKSQKRGIRVVGVQASGCPSMVRALEAGHPISLEQPRTIADGIRVGRVGDAPFEILRQHLDEMVLVDDEEISRAIVVLMEKSKLVVEAAGAVGVSPPEHAASTKAPITRDTAATWRARRRVVIVILSRFARDVAFQSRRYPRSGCGALSRHRQESPVRKRWSSWARTRRFHRPRQRFDH
jgi:threonine dehydratase